MRWHPCMVRWCLNLKLLSSAAYHSLRTSGFLTLPSEHTLRDYTHFIKSPAGFSSDLDQFLAEEADVDHLPDWKRHITLVLDEMKIKECLVCDKHETEVIGFADVGESTTILLDRGSVLVKNVLYHLHRTCWYSWCRESLLAFVSRMYTSLLPTSHVSSCSICSGRG